MEKNPKQTKGPDAVKVNTQAMAVINNIKKVIYVATVKLEYILAAQIASGHVILADSHGVGKTSLARALAGSFSWSKSGAKSASLMDPFSRVQCTVDLLPQDIIGFNRMDHKTGDFLFNKGPIFAHFVLCDEINLLTPKTQGSFFQAMEEQSVTIEGAIHQLGDPFFIIATMNLKGSHLFPLPAPQLDRFMIQLSLGYPDAEEEAAIIRKHGQKTAWDDFAPVADSKDLVYWQSQVDQTGIAEEVIQYITSVVRASRQHPAVAVGASPRTGVKLSRLSRALSLVRGESYVTLDTVKELLVPVLNHRLILHDERQNKEQIVDEIMKKVKVDRPVN